MQFFRSFMICSAVLSVAWSLLHSGQAAAAQTIANGYFVDCQGGNDSAIGTSPLTPWKTLANVSARVSTIGADVWLKAGTVCEDQQLTVDWSGTSTDHAVVGGYYVSGGVAYQNDPDEPTGLPVDYVYSHGARPEINGTNAASCGTACAYGSGSTSNPAAVPQNQYGALIKINPKIAYVDVQDLRLDDSSGLAVQASETTHVTVKRVAIDRTMNAFVQASKTRDFILRDSYMTRWGYVSYQQGGGKPAALSLTNAQDYTLVNRMLIENNDVAIGPNGEGIDPIFGANTVIIRGNRIGGLTGPCVYLQGKNLVVEYNICYGGTGLGSETTGVAGVGIKFQYEDGDGSTEHHKPMTGNIVRGNLLVNLNSCFGFTLEPTSRLDPAANYFEVEYYNNTCVLSGTGSAVNLEWLGPDNIGTKGLTFKNNIFYAPSASGDNQCYSPGRYGDLSSKLNFSNNLWAAAPDSDCSGTNDVVGNPLLTRMNYSAVRHDATPQFSDALPLPGSPALGAGTPITANIANLALQTQSSNVTYPCAAWDDKGGVLDAHCETRSTTKPSIGALDGTNRKGAAFTLLVD